MVVRRAKLEDLAAVVDLVRRVVPGMRAGGNLQWSEEYPNAAVFARDVEREQLWVAEIEAAAGQRIGGVAAITTDQQPEYANVGWEIAETAVVVHRLAVDPEFRGRGVAETLMRKAEAVARERGILLLRVDTNTQNQATQSLFPKLGYLLAGDTAFAGRPGLSFRCYEKRLV